jgi:NAD(P)-dependent dehydrogenase (short-subunit alcohol dehydrogenase family)
MATGKELALIAGGTGAFGQVIVEKLIARGLSVVVVGRRVAELEALAVKHPEVIPCVADIGEDAAIAQISAKLDRPVRIVINAAGVPVAGGVMSVTTDAILQAINIKVAGFLRLVRAADAQLVKHSRLVAIGGHYGLEPTAYAATAGVGNAALMNLSRQLSLAYGPRGITSHVIAPGPADTERLRNVLAANATLKGLSLAEVLTELKGESSLGQFTTPQQVAWAVGLLVDEEADAMTGSTFMLDSGRRRGLP